MKKFYPQKKTNYRFYCIIIFIIITLHNKIGAQNLTSPQVNFIQRSSTATPEKKIYNIKGDFTMLGNTNLTLETYGNNTNNEGKPMKYVDIDGDSNTLNSSMATLELSNGEENSANQDCSTVVYAGLYWTGKSDDANETFSVTKGFVTKNYDKKKISLKGPGDTAYTIITSNSDIRFPKAAQSGIFIGYHEVTDYVKNHGPGAYTVADIALKEGTNGTSAQNPGYSGGWAMIVIYENPVMKTRAVTLFDGYAYVNGQNNEYGTIPVSGFTTVASGQVNMKLGVMAAEGDVNSKGDYLAVMKADKNLTPYNTDNYLTFNDTGSSNTQNFFNSSIETTGMRNPNLQNNTGVDFRMFTIPNTNNSVIKNNQTSTTFRYGSTYEVYTIFGFAMSVESYIPEPKGLISVNSINNNTNPSDLNALPGQAINYSLNITNEGTEATNNTIISIPIPETAIFNAGSITYNTYHNFTPGTIPTYDSATNRIIWNLGTLPITAGHPEYIYADLSFNLNVTTDCAILLSAGCNPAVSLETGTIIGTGAVSGSSFTKYFFQGYDNSTCQLPINGSIKVAIDASSCLSSLAGSDQVTYCGGETVTLNASSGASGTWSIESGPSGGGEIFSNETSPTSTFYSPNIGVYTLTWTTSCGTTDNVLVTLELCNVVNFDGVDDNINFKNKFDLNSGNFSIEAWVKSNETNSNIQTILSKHLSPTATNGYDLRIINNVISFYWNNNSITTTHSIDTDRWYHITVTFDGTNYKLYIDGILEKITSGSNPVSNSADFIIGAMSQNTDTPYNYFNGWIDELRIWNIPLNEDQIRRMMNQEIINDGSNNVKGAVVPKNINGLNWTNLSGYYQMNKASDVSKGYLVDKSGNAINGKLKGIYQPEPDTAPIPYTSRIDGEWETDETWRNYDVWDPPYSLGIDNSTVIEWNIIESSHNITSVGNKTVLGLLVDSNTISANNDSKIEISSYLKLDGKIDLVGKSQLIQTLDSDLDISSSGSIERDQQGQSNLYNYNYWSSPVGTINTTANNINYTVKGVMKDGTTTTPKTITWIGGYNGSPTSPISIARFWLLKFDNYVNAYASWVQMNENTAIRVGQGYTMKGSGATSDTQNYSFVGKPNNGLINSNTITSDQMLLAGNPYPSSLDSEAFINDNKSSIDGNIYFWEHYASNNSHYLNDYQGGYATRNLTGGVAPSSANVDFISKLGTPSRGIPNRFIPVGQAFFVIGKSDSGGTITYNNNQRSFHKEDDAANSNVIYKITPQTKQLWQNNNNDIVIEENYKKIRLGFNSRNDYHRQVLLGFIDGKATDEMDFGYDAYNMDNFPNDMFFLIGENKFVIQGVGTFNKNASYPIGVKTDAEGIVKFMIDDVENFDPNQAIYIYDGETNTYNNIRTNDYEVNMVAGTNTTRFSLRFLNPADIIIDKEEELDTNDYIEIIHIQKTDHININNHIKNSNVKKVSLFNSTGHQIDNWKIEENRNQHNIQVHIKKPKLGVYIVKVETTKGEFTKKIIIQ
jgi:trimeric autotransporter adhesin